MTFACSVIYFNKSMNHSMYIDLGFKERITAIPSMVHVAIWGKEEFTEFDYFITFSKAFFLRLILTGIRR